MINSEKKKVFLFYFYKISKFMDFEKEKNVKVFLVSLWKIFTPICIGCVNDKKVKVFSVYLWNILKVKKVKVFLFVENWGPASNWQR